MPWWPENLEPASQLTGLLQLCRRVSDPYRCHGLGQECVEGGGFKLGGGMGGNGNLLDRPSVGCDLDSRSIAQHGRRALMERNQLECILQRLWFERVPGHKKAESNDPLARRGRVEEWEAVFLFGL